MRTRKPRTCASLLVALVSLASFGTAQSVQVVVPQQFDQTEAGGVAFWALSPFEARRQLVLGPSHLGSLVGKSIKSLTVRRNMGDASPLDGGLLSLKIWMSHSPRSPSGLSPTFDKNRGNDELLVFDGTISVPATPAAPSTPAPWTAPYAFTVQLLKPFVYVGGDLCIETLTNTVLGQSPPWWTADAVVERAGGAVSKYGVSCIPGMGDDPAGGDAHSMVVGSTAMFHLRGNRNTGSAVCMVGTSRTSYGGVTLPLDLGVVGAVGCELSTNPIVLNRSTAIASPVGTSPGLARWALLIPSLPSLAGAKIYTQWYVLDYGVNPLNLTFSNGVEATLGAARNNWDAGWIESPDGSSPVGFHISGPGPGSSARYLTRAGVRRRRQRWNVRRACGVMG